MAKYDYGGGCPCGLYAECVPGCINIGPATSVPPLSYGAIDGEVKMAEDDFGFSLVSEEELRAHEEELKRKMEEESKRSQQTEIQYKNKVDGLMAMIMPLLNNLSKDPTKQYVLWPDRAQKIEAFKKKIQDYVNS